MSTAPFDFVTIDQHWLSSTRSYWDSSIVCAGTEASDVALCAIGSRKDQIRFQVAAAVRPTIVSGSTGTETLVEPQYANLFFFGSGNWNCFESTGISTVSMPSALTTGSYSHILAQIAMVRKEEDVEDRPSDFATHIAEQVVSEAAGLLSKRFPPAIVSVGPSNSLRLIWHSPPREIRLVCGGSEQNKTYIYAEEGVTHRVENTVSGAVLSKYLAWLCEASE